MISQEHTYIVPRWRYNKLWRWNFPLKIKCFIWLTFENCQKTGDNLTHRAWIGKNRCSLCREEMKYVDHIFVNNQFTNLIWNSICSSLNISQSPGVQTFEHNFFLCIMAILSITSTLSAFMT